MADLMSLAVRELGALEVGVLRKLLADGGLNNTEAVPYSIQGHAKGMGVSRHVLAGSLRALAQAGYIDLQSTTGDKAEREHSRVRLLDRDEVKAKVAAAGYGDAIVEAVDSL